MVDRQICAQLLRIFLAREHDPHAFPSVSAAELDHLYHEHTDFNPKGAIAERFIKTLDHVAAVFEHANQLMTKRNKFLRADVASVMMLVQDVTQDPNSRIDKETIRHLAQVVVEGPGSDKPMGKSTSGKILEKHYRWFRERANLRVLRLDSQRAFNQSQRDEISERDQRRCGVCNDVVEEGEAEFDHFPIPWYQGGRTETGNGRLVHAKCHPRGRPKS